MVAKVIFVVTKVMFMVAKVMFMLTKSNFHNFDSKKPHNARMPILHKGYKR